MCGVPATNWPRNPRGESAGEELRGRIEHRRPARARVCRNTAPVSAAARSPVFHATRVSAHASNHFHQRIPLRTTWGHPFMGPGQFGPGPGTARLAFEALLTVRG